MSERLHSNHKKNEGNLQIRGPHEAFNNPQIKYSAYVCTDKVDHSPSWPSIQLNVASGSHTVCYCSDKYHIQAYMCPPSGLMILKDCGVNTSTAFGLSSN